MTRKLFWLSNWFVSDPMRIRMVIFIFLLTLALVAVVAPGVVAFAGEAPGTGH